MSKTVEDQFQPVGHVWMEKHTASSFLISEMVAWRWRQLAQEKNITDDSTLATFLIKHYEETQDSQIQAPFSQTCCSPLVQFCSTCFTLTPKQQQLASSRQSAALTDGNMDRQNETVQERTEPDCGSDDAAIGICEKDNSSSVIPTLKEIIFMDENTAGNNAIGSGKDTDVENYLTSTQLTKAADSKDMTVDIKSEDDSFNFKTETDESIHIKNSLDSGEQSETFTCDFCIKVFFDPDLLIMHMQEHSDQMPHKCGKCKARFFQTEILELHMNTHYQQKKYPCDQCNASYTRIDNLTKHKSLKHHCQVMKRNRRSKAGDVETSKQTGQPTNRESSQERKDQESVPLGRISNVGNMSVKGGVKFTCDQCGKGFSRKDHLQSHVLTHSGEKQYGCQQCGVAFAHLRSLVAHMHSHSSHRPFQCGKCHKSFTVVTNMTKHVCKFNTPKLQCISCGKKFVTSSQLILHSHLHLAKSGTSQPSADFDPEKPTDQGNEQLKYQKANSTDQVRELETKNRRPRRCSAKSKISRNESKGNCGSSLPKSEHQTTSVQKPVQPDAESHPHCCEFCGARFKFQSHLSHHLQDHTGKNAFRCSQCPVSCRSLARLEIHTRSHRSTKNFSCHYCGKVLKSNYTLKQHLCSHTGKKPFMCEECGSSFIFSSTYKAHLRSHTGDRPYLCPHCGKSFVRSSNLCVHIRTHTHGGKDYPCQYCGKILRNVYTLKEHLRSHTGEKPFKCDVCGACFTLSGTYKAHLRKHTGARPYLCPHCGKSFVHSSNLSVHVRIHTGEKPYKCSRCPMVFAIPNSLTEHMRKHTGDKPYMCSICGKGFAKSCNRLAHFRIHNKNKLNLTVQCVKDKAESKS